MSTGVAMARVQLAVIAQYWSASGPMELFVVVVKNSITNGRSVLQFRLSDRYPVPDREHDL